MVRSGPSDRNDPFHPAYSSLANKKQKEDSKAETQRQKTERTRHTGKMDESQSAASVDQLGEVGWGLRNRCAVPVQLFLKSN